MSNELVVIDQNTDMAVFFKPESIDDVLAKIRKEVEGFIPDTSTAKGRKEIASLAAKVARSKTLIDGAGKKYVAELKALPKQIDAERKRLRDECDKIKNEVRKPLTDWEADRKLVDDMIAIINSRAFQLQQLDSPRIKENLEYFNSFELENFVEDKRADLENTLTMAKSKAEAALLKAEKAEKEAAELERLRAEEAERKRKEEEAARIKAAEERAKKEAEEAAKRRELEAKLAKEEAERREREAVERAERAEREAKERAELAAKQAKEKAERDAREKTEREEAARKKREADQQHRAEKINQTTASFRMNGYSSEEALRLTAIIADGKIANVKMVF